MPLYLAKRGNSPFWYIRGSIRGVVVDETTGLRDKDAAEEVLALRQVEVLTRSIHGDRAVRTFADAALSYVEAGGEVKFVLALADHFGPKKLLADIGQAEIDEAARKLKPGAAPATLNRQIYTPAAAVLHHAARKRWCDKPVIARPSEPKGRVRWLTPEEADRLVANAGHLQPFVIFLLCTGARLSEALYLDWRNVDLSAMHATFLNTSAGGVGTKNDESRGVPLHPRAVAALANLPHRSGKVFRRHYGGPRWDGKIRPVGEGYKDRKGAGGGQIKTAWNGMLKRAQITDFTPHDCRHTWATWHYAANRDIGALMQLGGWKTPDMVMRYAHVNTSHLAGSVNRIWEVHGNSELPDFSKSLPRKA